MPCCAIESRSIPAQLRQMGWDCRLLLLMHDDRVPPHHWLAGMAAQPVLPRVCATQGPTWTQPEGSVHVQGVKQRGSGKVSNAPATRQCAPQCPRGSGTRTGNPVVHFATEQAVARCDVPMRHVAHLPTASAPLGACGAASPDCRHRHCQPARLKRHMQRLVVVGGHLQGGGVTPRWRGRTPAKGVQAQQVGCCIAASCDMGPRLPLVGIMCRVHVPGTSPTCAGYISALQVITKRV